MVTVPSHTLLGTLKGNPLPSIPHPYPHPDRLCPRRPIGLAPEPGITCLPGPPWGVPKDRLGTLGVGLTQKVPPLGIQVGLVGKAALQHVLAIVGARPGSGDPQAVSTVDQLHDSP